MKIIKFTHKIAIVFLYIISLALPVHADSLTIHNYDKDPILSMAMQYDRGETTDRPMADREKAEQYYLEYLEKDIPSFQKARVYLRLGALYTVESDPKRGIMPEREKGLKYLEKVLEFEPERIDPVTVRARTLLGSMWLPKEERIRKRLDVYEWLSSLDDSQYQTLWLPLEPNDTTIRPIIMEKMQGLIPSLKKTESKNIVASAASKQNSEELLLEIIERFPNDQIANLARDRLRLPIEEVADETIEHLESGFFETMDIDESLGLSNTESQASQITEEIGKLEEIPFTEQDADSLILAETSQINERSYLSKIIYPLLICLIIIGAFLFYNSRIRKKTV